MYAYIYVCIWVSTYIYSVSTDAWKRTRPWPSSSMPSTALLTLERCHLWILNLMGGNFNLMGIFEFNGGIETQRGYFKLNWMGLFRCFLVMITFTQLDLNGALRGLAHVRDVQPQSWRMCTGNPACQLQISHRTNGKGQSAKCGSTLVVIFGGMIDFDLLCWSKPLRSWFKLVKERKTCEQ